MWKKLLVVLVLVAALAAFFALGLGEFLSFESLQDQKGALQDYARDHRSATIALFGGAYVVMAALSLPGAAIMTIAAGVIFGLVLGTLVVSFSSTIGATLAFLVSRSLLRDTIQSRFGSNLTAINEGIRREGAFYLFSLRLIPLFPFFVINLVFGLTPIRTSTFYWVSQLGMLGGTAVYVNAGTQLSQLSSPAGILSPGLLGSFVLIGLFPLFTRKVLESWKRRRAGDSMSIEGDETGPERSRSGGFRGRAARGAMLLGLLLAVAVVVGWRAVTVVGAAPSTGERPPELFPDTCSDSFAAVLSRFVDDRGFVDYEQLAKDRSELDNYTRSIAYLDPASYEEWDQEQQLAFWCNAYNAWTLQVIVENFPISRSLYGTLQGAPANSIRQIPWVWDKLPVQVMGESMTLGHIEHGILRQDFVEPRIHMAINCASVGCPPLRNEPFDSGRWEAQLVDQTRRFLDDPSKFRIDREAGVVFLSPIFLWFGEDFVKSHLPADGFGDREAPMRAVLAFAAASLPDEDSTFLRSGAFEVRKLDYDWSLNEQ